MDQEGKSPAHEDSAILAPLLLSPCRAGEKPVVPGWERGDNHLQGSHQPPHNNTNKDQALSISSN